MKIVHIIALFFVAILQLLPVQAEVLFTLEGKSKKEDAYESLTNPDWQRPEKVLLELSTDDSLNFKLRLLDRKGKALRETTLKSNNIKPQLETFLKDEVFFEKRKFWPDRELSILELSAQVEKNLLNQEELKKNLGQLGRPSALEVKPTCQACESQSTHSDPQSHKLAQYLESQGAGFENIFFDVDDSHYFINKNGEIYSVLLKDHLESADYSKALPASTGSTSSLLAAYVLHDTGFRAARSDPMKATISVTQLADLKSTQDQHLLLYEAKGNLETKRICLTTLEKKVSGFEVSGDLCQHELKMTEAYYDDHRDFLLKKLDGESPQIDLLIYKGPGEYERITDPLSKQSQSIGLSVSKSTDVSGGVTLTTKVTPSMVLHQGNPDAKKYASKRLDMSTEIKFPDESFLSVSAYLGSPNGSTLLEAHQEVKMKKITCGGTLNYQRKLWRNAGMAVGVDYYCPMIEDNVAHPMAEGGIVPYVSGYAKIDGKLCAVTLKNEDKRKLYLENESYQLFQEDLHKFGDFSVTVTCIGEDGKGHTKIYLNNEGTLELQKTWSIALDKKREITPSVHLSLMRELGASVSYTDLDKKHALTLGGNYSPFAGASVGVSATKWGELDELFKGLSPEAQERIKKVLDGISSKRTYQLDASLSQNLTQDDVKALGSLGISLTFSDGRYLANFPTSFDYTLETSLRATTGGDLGVANGYLRLGKNTDAFLTAKISDTKSRWSGTLLHHLGEKSGPTLGLQVGQNGWVAGCAGHFSKEKTGIDQYIGLCTNGASADFYYLPNCNTLPGSQCKAYFLGILGLRRFKIQRPGEHYMTPDGNIVGLDEKRGPDGEKLFEFHLVQFDDEVRQARKRVFDLENEISSKTPLFFSEKGFSDLQSVHEYEKFLKENLFPYLKSEKINSVRFELGKSGENIVNELDSDGVLWVRDLKAQLPESVLEGRYQFSREKKNYQIPSLYQELEAKLKSKGVLFDFSPENLRPDELNGVKNLLGYLDQTFTEDQLRGRRLILRDHEHGVGRISQMLSLTSGQKIQNDLQVSTYLLEKMSKVPSLTNAPVTDGRLSQLMQFIKDKKVQTGGIPFKVLSSEDFFQRENALRDESQGTELSSYSFDRFFKFDGKNIFVNEKELPAFFKKRFPHSPERAMDDLFQKILPLGLSEFHEESLDKLVGQSERMKTHGVSLGGSDSTVVKVEPVLKSSLYRITDRYGKSFPMNTQAKLASCFSLGKDEVIFYEGGAPDPCQKGGKKVEVKKIKRAELESDPFMKEIFKAIPGLVEVFKKLKD